MDSGALIGIIGILLTIIGIPVTFIVARRSRQRPDLRYLVDFDVLLRPTDQLFDEGLYMTLGPQKIDSLSRTRLAFWNQRGDTVRSADVLESDPLRLQFSSKDQPLQARVITMSRTQISLETTLDSEFESCALINFDFLDAGDGGVVEVIHQGTEKPVLVGTIRGAKSSSKGSANLGPDSISRLTEISRSSKRRQFLAAIGLRNFSLLLLAIIPLALFGAFLGSSNPRGILIDTKQYNLNTINGQVAFATSVGRTPYYVHSEFQFLGFAFLALAFVVLITFAVVVSVRTRRRIPVSSLKQKPACIGDRA